MFPEFFEFYTATRMVAGPGLVKESLGFEVEKLGAGKALIVTDKVIRSVGLVDKVISGLQDSSIEVVGIFDDIMVNSEMGLAKKGAAFAKETGADLLIAIGGGSVIDTAKVMNIIWVMGGDLEEYQGLGHVDKKLKPLVVIPTTAGTGSEVTQYAVIKDDAAHLKNVFGSHYLMPDLAVLDPELTLGMPPELTASTGMDALVHAIESHFSTNNNPISDGMAFHAIKLITANIVTATKNGSDVDARYGMLVGSTVAGMACSSALLNIVHAISHTLGGICNVPHGIANTIMLPYCMEFVQEVVADRLANIARAMGIETNSLSDIESSEKAIAKIRELIQDCGLPSKLSQVGVSEDDLAEVATVASIDGGVLASPVQKAAEDMEKNIYLLLKKAY